MLSLFVITDGTTTVDLMALNKNGWGIGIDSYTPGRAQMKDGGYWQDSPLATGRHLAYSVKGNVNDALTIKFSYRSHNEIIQEQERLDGLIEKAANYWQSEWADEPVYIKAQAQGESNPRYAIIYNITFPEYQDPYAQPFNTASPPYVADGIVLGIEHGAWTENAPGTGTAVAISHTKHSTASTTGVYVASARNDGLSHIYSFTGSFGSNLLSGATPYNLFSGTIAVGSICYFGSSYPFRGLILDLSTAMSSTTSYTLTWEFSDGAAGWPTIGSSPQGTPQLNSTGIIFVLLYPDYTWATETVNGVASKYWIRARVSAKTGTVTSARQQNRHVYSAVIPYVNVASTQITGSINALARIKTLITRIAAENPGSILFGIRDNDRGSSFTAYINVKTADNPSGVSVTTSTDTAYYTYSISPTGFLIRYTSISSTTFEERFNVQFTSAIANQFYGRFRLFVRVNIGNVGGTTQIRYKLYAPLTNPVVIATSTLAFTGQTKTITNPQTLIDLGYIQIPPTNLVRQSENFGSFAISIEAVTVNTYTLDFYDLILLPVDEWSGTFTSVAYTDVASATVDIDSITYPKYELRALQKTLAGTRIDKVLSAVYRNSASLPANTSTNIWFVQGDNIVGYDVNIAQIQISRQQRYLGLRSS